MPGRYRFKINFSASCLYPLLAALFTIFGGPNIFGACPAALSVEDMGYPALGSRAGDFRALSWNGSQWSAIEFDLVSFDRRKLDHRRRREIFSSDGFDIRHDKLGDFERQLERGDAFVFGSFGQGTRAPESSLKKWIRQQECSVPMTRVLELSRTEYGGPGQILYVIHCPGVSQRSSLAVAPISHPVQFDADDLVVTGDLFTYAMNHKNQMLFDHLSIRDSRGSWFRLANDGAFDIRADFKNFFTTHFTAESVGSKIENFFVGKSVTLAKLSFGLSILFFKVDLDLETDVLFSRDTVFVPMVLSIPKKASRYVHPGSGVLYSWTPARNFSVDVAAARMPVREKFSDNFTSKDKVDEVVAAHCGLSGLCKFDVALTSSVSDGAPFRLRMEILLQESLVRRGLFPLLIENVQGEASAAGWVVKRPGQPRNGIYFELSNLDSGQHGIDIWLRLEELSNLPKSVTSCANPVSIRRMNISS